LTNTWIRRYFR